MIIIIVFIHGEGFGSCFSFPRFQTSLRFLQLSETSGDRSCGGRRGFRQTKMRKGDTMAWIDFSKGAIPRYRKLLTDANQMSFQNTVLVHNDNDSWWLGYIQDMEGDHAFINFDSTIVAACWVHMRAVWPFPLYWDRDGHGTNPDCRNAPVFVALRDEDNGPFRFRPAVILELISCCKTFEGMFYITTDASYANTPLQKPRFEMVGDGQVVNLLPPTGPPLIKRCSGLLYNKHFVPFAKAQALLRDPSDKFRIISHLYTNDLRKRMGLPFPSDCRRFHLRIEQDGCMFIIISFANDPQTMQRTTAKLLEVLETHMTSRDKLPPIAYRIFRPNEGVACKADVELNAMTPSDSIRNLPPLLLENVFPHLDLHSQMRMKR
ncbi:uncharacterized protein LOC129593208 isoform X2 [Paramacrobiotus metropolitanus]|uniref:uncharacterized protein LOC129593208 isoform X2 n=1 Tax=Paramacrobiotus metropolitanus TaxID=2943436 RepID=UPI002445AFCF|nr:uncharacterized protein LOC129593208 isoform X2 [Paramacrobiotus metropolitanus]